jgi:hypothetical protein
VDRRADPECQSGDRGEEGGYLVEQELSRLTGQPGSLIPQVELRGGEMPIEEMPMDAKTLEAVLEAYNTALDGLADLLEPLTDDMYVHAMVGAIRGRNFSPEPESELLLLEHMFKYLGDELEFVRKEVFGTGEDD